MTAPIRRGTAQRLGLHQPTPPPPSPFRTLAEALDHVHRAYTSAFARMLEPSDAEKAATFRRALGAQR